MANAPAIFREEFRKLSQQVFTVQIGAMDGVHFDPLRPVLGREQAALLVEPLPHHFASLKLAYRDYRRVQLSNVALNVYDGYCTMYYIPDTTGLPLWTEGLGSLARGRNALRRFKDCVTSIQVACVTWESLLSRHRVRAVDVLVVDAEGFDDVIVKHFPFDRFAPRLLMYETCNLSATAQLDMAHFVERLGFQPRSDGRGNAVWVREPRPRPKRFPMHRLRCR